MSKEAVFQRVSALLRPFAANLSIKDDTEKSFYLEESRSIGKPKMFAAVQLKASYVALHVYPLYVYPELLDTLSPQLRSRMQGKSCFNFKHGEQVLDEEIRRLLQAAYCSIDARI
jgi:hypothetical protein